MRFGDIVALAILGLVGYVAYEHYGQGKTWQQSVSFVPGLGCEGCGHQGMGAILPVGLYGGYSGNSSGRPGRLETAYNARVR